MFKKFDGKDWIVCVNLLILGILVTLYTHDFAGIVGYLLLFSTYAQIRARFEYQWNEMVRVRIYAEEKAEELAFERQRINVAEDRLDQHKAIMVKGMPIKVLSDREAQLMRDDMTKQEVRIKYMADSLGALQQRVDILGNKR